MTSDKVKKSKSETRKWPNSKLTDAEIQPRYDEHLKRLDGPAKVNQGGK